MKHYLIKYALICKHIEQKSEHRIKPGSKFLFHFVDTLKLKIFADAFQISLLSLFKSENTVNRLKKIYFHQF